MRLQELQIGTQISNGSRQRFWQLRLVLCSAKRDIFHPGAAIYRNVYIWWSLIAGVAIFLLFLKVKLIIWLVAAIINWKKFFCKNFRLRKRRRRFSSADATRRDDRNIFGWILFKGIQLLKNLSTRRTIKNLNEKKKLRFGGKTKR